LAAALGGKHTGEAAIETARLAKAAGKPVRLQWSREEEFTWAYFRPAGVIDAEATLDAQANLPPGISSISTREALPSKRHIARSNRGAPRLDPSRHFRQGSYRALSATANTFARESFMDELAAPGWN
jgi:isoquinoline 1-oxidoreductase